MKRIAKYLVLAALALPAAAQAEGPCPAGEACPSVTPYTIAPGGPTVSAEQMRALGRHEAERLGTVSMETATATPNGGMKLVYEGSFIDWKASPPLGSAAPVGTRLELTLDASGHVYELSLTVNKASAGIARHRRHRARAHAPKRRTDWP